MAGHMGETGTGYVLWLGIWGNFDGFPYSCLLFKDECDPELKTELFGGGRRGTYKSTKVGKSCLIVVNK